jgi:hypothetical protein
MLPQLIWGSITKCHSLSSDEQQTIIFPGSAGWKSKTKATADLMFGDGCSLLPRWCLVSRLPERRVTVSKYSEQDGGTEKGPNFLTTLFYN